MRIFILRLYKKRPPATDLQSAALNCAPSLSGRSKPPFSAALKIAAGRNHIKKGAPQNRCCEIRCACFCRTLVCLPFCGGQQPPAMRADFFLRLYKKRPPATDLQSAALNCTQSLSWRSKPPFSAALKIAAGSETYKKRRAAKSPLQNTVRLFLLYFSMSAAKR